MSGEIETFLDETPGETRGVVARNGRYVHLLIERDSDVAQHRLGARSVGRVAEIDAGMKGAFVDLGTAPAGFLPLGKTHDLRQGQKIEVEVIAERRERKSPTLRRIGAAEGEPRLIHRGPTVVQTLASLAQDVEPAIGVVAIQAVKEAEEEALSGGGVFAGTGLDLRVQRTRAMIAVDIDHVGARGRDIRTGRRQANVQGLTEAARLVRLNRWGGLVAIDLVGAGHEGDVILKAARDAFGAEPDIAFGPLNKFGVLMLSLPWRLTPLDEVLNGQGARRSLETRALDLTRLLRLALLSDTGAPRLIARCAPQEAALAASWVARLGPRAGLIADPTVMPGHCSIEET